MMKAKKIEVEMVDGEGLVALLGQRVLLLCANYFYEGVLEGVNETCVLLSDAGIVYETGKWDDASWGDRQQLPCEWYVQREAVESYGLSPSVVMV
jgi:hypothetical protein